LGHGSLVCDTDCNGLMNVEPTRIIWGCVITGSQLCRLAGYSDGRDEWDLGLMMRREIDPALPDRDRPVSVALKKMDDIVTELVNKCYEGGLGGINAMVIKGGTNVMDFQYIVELKTKLFYDVATTEAIAEIVKNTPAVKCPRVVSLWLKTVGADDTVVSIIR